jgi:hypothetical protein
MIFGGQNNVHSTLNASTSPLTAGSTYTGTSEQVFYPSIGVAVKTDQDGTLYVDFSDDGTNWDSVLPTLVSAGTNEIHPFSSFRKYYRVRFTNTSASNQTYLRLSSMQAFYTVPNSLLNSQIQQDANAIVVRGVDSETEIALGRYSGYSPVNKVGRNPDVDTATVPEDICGNGGTYLGWATAAELVQVLSSSASDTAAGTGARTIVITGLDTNYEIQSESITLNGTTPVSSVGTYIRVHTARITSAGSGGVNAGSITIRQATTTSNIFALMQIGVNGTNESAYTVPAGYSAIVQNLHGSIRGSATASVDVNFYIRAFGEVFRARRPDAIQFGVCHLKPIKYGLLLAEKTDIIVRCTAASANNLDVVAGYDLLLIKN